MGRNNLLLEGDCVIEVTKSCPYDCDFCLRGKSREVFMTKETIDKILDNYCYIKSLTFTGGEPTLNLDIILYTIQEIIRRNIPVGYFYIVTNAMKYEPKLVLSLLDLYAHCDEKEFCGLCVSRDNFHIYYDNDAYEKYSALSFFSKDKEHENGDVTHIINRGLAFENGLGTYEPEVIEFDVNNVNCYNGEVSYDGLIYIDANGYVFFDCDLSYEMQDELRTINVLNDSIPEWMYNQAISNPIPDLATAI